MISKASASLKDMAAARLVLSITLAAMALVVVLTLAANQGDPLALARLGTYYSQGDPDGSRGYDGQFVYTIARDLDPSIASQYLDAPAYRYQRILFPLAARLAALGQVGWIPWSLIFVGVLSHLAGTWVMVQLLAGQEKSAWYALPYGLWVGFLLAIRLDLPEPMAIGLALAGLLARQRKLILLSWVLLGLAMFAKETTFLFAGAVMVVDLLERRWSNVTGGLLVMFLPYALFQVWLRSVFGEFGIGSGGDMATPFEVIPLMGLIRIAAYSLPYFIAMLVVFLPAVVLPALWGLWFSIRQYLKGETNLLLAALAANAVVILFLPFSTFREPGGLLRFACSLVPVVVLAAGQYGRMRVLNYSFLWIVLNVFLLKS